MAMAPLRDRRVALIPLAACVWIAGMALFAGGTSGRSRSDIERERMHLHRDLTVLRQYEAGEELSVVALRRVDMLRRRPEGGGPRVVPSSAELEARMAELDAERAERTLSVGALAWILGAGAVFIAGLAWFVRRRFGPG